MLPLKKKFKLKSKIKSPQKTSQFKGKLKMHIPQLKGYFLKENLKFQILLN